MKRLLFSIVTMLVVSTLGFSYSGDARVRGMGGAFTAVADDTNAIVLNPAGLAYLTSTQLLFGAGVNVEMRKRLAYGEDTFPSVWYDSYHGEYQYWDEFLGTHVRFDPADFGFPYYVDTPGAYDAAVESYIEWREAYNFYEMAENTSDFRMIPHFAYANRNWGISSIADNVIDFRANADEYEGRDTPIDVFVRRRTGVRGAVGLGFGPVAVGATAKFMKTSTYTLGYVADDMRHGPPDDLFPQVLFGPRDGNIETEEFWNFELGIGGMFTLGPFTVGTYLDNLLYFVATDESGTTVDAGLFDTLSLGVAWTPLFDRLRRSRSPLNLIVAADLRNLASHSSRELAAGFEAGINFGRVVMANVRGGYTQGLPGPLSDAFGSFNPYLGSYTIGGGFKFMIVEFNAAYTMPSDMFFDPPMGRLTEERLDELLGTFVFEFRVSF